MAIDGATTPVMMTPEAIAFNQFAVSFVRSLWIKLTPTLFQRDEPTCPPAMP